MSRTGRFGAGRLMPSRLLHTAACLVLAMSFSSAACTSASAGGGPLDPRFVAVHNALSAMGMAQVGPLQQGTLPEGHEARASLSLPAGCVTIVTIGGEGIRDLDAKLLDPHGTPLAHDTTNEPEAALRACLETADVYSLVITAVSGSGSWVTATWAGGDGPLPAAPRPGAGGQAPEANGTCEAPIPLEPGVVTGSTTRGRQEYAGSCSPSDSRELVYELDVAHRERVSIEVEAHFDSVLYIRKDDCNDNGAEIDCNDDAPDRTRSRIERVLEPGKYFIFVDGYGHEAGAFKMTVTATDVVALSDLCNGAASLLDGASRSGTTLGMANDVQATCGGGANGADVAWRAQLASRARVRIVEHSDDIEPVVHVRRACADEDSEVACADIGATAGDATITGIFEPGAYIVFADAHEPDSGGSYTMFFQTLPPEGAGTSSDGCADATLLQGASGSIEGDTFAARDDVAGSCGGQGAADVIYRIDAAKTSRLLATMDGEEAPHVLVLSSRCGDPGAEIACARTLDAVVGPGTYFIAVDGERADALGRFTLHWTLHDLAPQADACARATTLGAGREISGSTAASPDSFATECAASDGAAGAPDRVYRIVLPVRSKIRLTVRASTFRPALAVRAACADAPGSPPPLVACESNTDDDAATRTVIERMLEAGVYWVVVDGQSPSERGEFKLEYDVLH